MYQTDKIIDTLSIYNKRYNYELLIDDILNILQIARSTLYEWVNKYNHNNIDINYIISDRTLHRLRSKNTITDECEKYIIDHVQKYSNFNIKKLVKKITKKFDVYIKKSKIYRILKENNMTYKKVQKNSYPHNKHKFKKSAKILKKQIDDVGTDYTSIDETGIYLGTRPNRGWSKKNTRCIVKTLFNRSNKYSYVLAISKNKIIGSRLIKKSYNTKKFNDYIKEEVLTNIDNNAILMDGASIHKSSELAILLKNNNIKKIINVPYSPQFNPIEKVFNVLKNNIKKNNVDTHKQMVKCINNLEKKLNKTGFKNYFDDSYNILNLSVK